MSLCCALLSGDLISELVWFSDHGDTFDCQMFCYSGARYHGSSIFRSVNRPLFRPPFEYTSVTFNKSSMLPLLIEPLLVKLLLYQNILKTLVTLFLYLISLLRLKVKIVHQLKRLKSWSFVCLIISYLTAHYNVKQVRLIRSFYIAY